MCLRGLFRGSGQTKASRPQSKSSTAPGPTSGAASASPSSASSAGPLDTSLSSQTRPPIFSLPGRSSPKPQNVQTSQVPSIPGLSIQPADQQPHQGQSFGPQVIEPDTDDMPPRRGSKAAKRVAKNSSENAASKFSKLTMGRSKQRGYFNAGGSAGASSASAQSKLDKEFDGLKKHEEDSENSLGVKSTMEYLTSLGVNPENAEVFVAMELFQAQTFGEITRKGFVDGWGDAGVSATKAAQTQHLRSRIQKLSKDPAYFKQVFRHAFVAGKEGDQKALALENAIEFWKVLFSEPGRPWQTDKHDWLGLWTEFLSEKWTRSVNRDMWNMTLEFATKSMKDETLSFYDPDGAWPSVIDDFVTWCHEKGIGGNAKADAAMDVD